MNKRALKRQKCTHMSPKRFKRIRLAIGFDLRAFARVLGLPYRTCQDYEYGRRGIPAKVAADAREVHRRDREFMRQLRRNVAADIHRLYPAGIPSEPDIETIEEAAHG